MKKIFFKKIGVRNFLSIGSDVINLDFEQGINLITGVNLDKEDAGNGSGKSSLVSSIYFALYGRALKDLKIDQIPNSYTRGPCEARLEFDVHQDNKVVSYTVIRSLRPTKLILLENGNDITKSTIVQTSEMLQNIISCSSTVFENSIVMDANGATAFMSQKKVEKRKFLEGILNLGVFGDMLSIARSDFNDIKYRFDVEDVKLKSEISNLNNYKEQSDKQKLARLERENDIRKRVDGVTAEIETLTSTLKNCLSSEERELIQSRHDKLITAKKSNRDNSKVLMRREVELVHLEKDFRRQIDKLNNLPDECLECNRPFSDIDRRYTMDRCKSIELELNRVLSDIGNVKAEMVVNDDQYKKIERALSVLIQKQCDCRLVDRHNESVNWKIGQLQKSLVDLQRDLVTVNQENVDFISLINDLTGKVELLRSTVNELNKKLEILHASKFILSEEGIRSFIVKKILKVLNSKLNMYLVKLDANTRCEFNEYFEETLWDISGNERSYYNFSSGEQRRIDLAILFAFQDIRRLQADVCMNISIYDELLDSSLDRKGAELVLFLLKERADKNKECVYIVSHRKEAQSSYTNRVITLQKKNGITTMMN